MYEIWLMLNIVWEILLAAWPLVLVLLVLFAGLMLAALSRRSAAWRAALPVAIGGAVIVGVGSFLLLPGLTRSSLGELKYWVDWLALAGVAGGFALVAAALLLPLAALLRRQPT
jgi:uncharacterized membrane protein